MKKLFSLLLGFCFCAGLYADQFKIRYGATGPQSLTNISLDLLNTAPPYLSTVTTSSISPTDYSPTDSSVTISYPGSCNQIVCFFNIPAEYDETYSVAGAVYPNTTYILGYDPLANMFGLTGPVN
jgi:hypothetical protein